MQTRRFVYLCLKFKTISGVFILRFFTISDWLEKNTKLGSAYEENSTWRETNPLSSKENAIFSRKPPPFSDQVTRTYVINYACAMLNFAYDENPTFNPRDRSPQRLFDFSSPWNFFQTPRRRIREEHTSRGSGVWKRGEGWFYAIRKRKRASVRWSNYIAARVFEGTKRFLFHGGIRGIPIRSIRFPSYLTGRVEQPRLR